MTSTLYTLISCRITGEASLLETVSLFCLPSSQQVKQFPADSPATQLVQVLKETDPDDSFSSVPYEKGSCFLYYLEQILGGPGFKILFSIFSTCLR